MILRPPSDLKYAVVRSFPDADTPAQRFALLDAIFADLYASARRIWMAVLPAEAIGEIIVIFGSDAPAPGVSGWFGSDLVPIERFPESSERYCNAASSVLLRPRIRPEPGLSLADTSSRDTMTQLRLLEQSRHQADLQMIVIAERASPGDGEHALDQALRLTSSSVANQTRAVTSDEWTDHHRAVATSVELARGATGGLWDVRVEFACDRSGAAGRAVSAMNEALRLLTPVALVSDESQGAMLTTSRFLSCLGIPPFGELPGFRSIPVWSFDQMQERSDAKSVVDLGKVLSPTGVPGGSFALSEENLVRHTLVTGATGSGKTVTVKRLLHGISESLDRPWLIIEPAKSEYRHVRFGVDGTKAPLVIRPGDPTVPPICFNPLEPEPGFPLRTHVDLVLSLFVAAFEPVDPLPQLLAAAIEHAYTSRGWIVPIGVRDQVDREPRPHDYPGLGDLQRAADEVIDGIGYVGETLGNVRGFVNVRLKSLRLGTAGGMLERGYPVDFAALMRERVVFELDDIGNDQEKSFLMGVILVRLYEFLRVQVEVESKNGRSSRRFSHVTVVEEAHRLLRAALPGERSNFAVETFANMLAELRSYGEGLIIVEQVPSKIISDAVKNTGTKILHRLPALDDRHFAGFAANVTPEQVAAIGALPPGQAIGFTDEMDRPCRVAITPAPDGAVSSSTSPVTGVLRDKYWNPSHPSEIHSLEPLVRAQRMVEQAVSVSLWLEIAFYYAAHGWQPYRPSDLLVEQLATLPRVARLRLIEESLEVRDAALCGLIDRHEHISVLMTTFDKIVETRNGDRLEACDVLGETHSVDARRRSELALGAGRVKRLVTLAEVLRDSGVATSAIQTFHHIHGVKVEFPPLEAIFR